MEKEKDAKEDEDRKGEDEKEDEDDERTTWRSPEMRMMRGRRGDLSR